MPIYEYKCTKCGKEFELFQNITDPAAKRCTSCKGPVNKMISMSSFHLKGSGWYVTDYGGKKAPSSEPHKDNTVKSETTEPAKAESTSKTGTDAE
jgi:putative FmdB family regulatory protein